MQTYLKTKPVGIQLLLFTGMALGLFVVLSTIGAMALSAFTGIELGQIGDLSKWKGDTTPLLFYLRGLQLLQFLGLFFLPSLLFGYFSDPNPKAYLGFKRPYTPLFWLLGILLLLVSYPLVDFLGNLNQQLVTAEAARKWEADRARELQLLLGKQSFGGLLLNLVFISGLAAVGEEIFFRGVLQRLFIRLTANPLMGIFFAAFLFSAFHFQFLGFLPRLVLGMLLGLTYWYSGSLWTAILAHFVYDALIIVVVYLNPAMLQNVNASLVPESMNLPAAIVSAVLMAALVLVMKKRSPASYRQLHQNDVPPTDQFSF